MKKLRRLNLKSATLMNDDEMKMILGGSSASADCPAQSSNCGGNGCMAGGRPGKCKEMWVVNRFLCACVQN